MDADQIMKFIRLTYAGLSDGALLALIALGLVLVFKATDVINFAHGEFMLLGAFIGYQLLTWLEPVANSGVAAVMAVVGMVLAMIAVGVVVERLVLRPMIGEPVISVIMITVGLANIIQAIVGAVWGMSPSPYPSAIIASRGRFEMVLEGARRPLFLAHDKLVAIIIVFVLVVLLIAFFRRSKHGVAMRASADDQQAAMSMGISIKVVFAITWSMAAIMAGLAGLLIADLTIGAGSNIPGVGLRAFPVIILGGLDSIAGAVIGGLAIGLIEVYAGGYIDPSLKSVAPYVVLLVIMMVRPYGLFGQEIIERV